MLEYFKQMAAPQTKEFMEQKYQAIEELFLYCKHLTECYDCEICRTILDQRSSQAAIEVIFHGEWGFSDDEKNAFTRIVSLCDSLNIADNPCGEGWIQVTFFINDIWA